MFSAIKVASFCNGNCWFNFGTPVRISTSINNVQDRPIISSIRRLSKTFGRSSSKSPPSKSPAHSFSSRYSSAMSSFRRSARDRAQQSCKNQALKNQVMLQHGQVDITYRISNSSKGILVKSFLSGNIKVN